MNTKKFFFAVAALVMLMGVGFSFTACSDDENNSEGNAAVTELKNMLLDEDGTPAFLYNEKDGVYEVGVSNRENALEIAGKYLDVKNYAGGQKTRTLPDGMGSITATDGETEGVFTSILFAIKDIKSFRLNIVQSERLEDENGVNHKVICYIHCNKCSMNWTSGPMTKACIRCGSTNISIAYDFEGEDEVAEVKEMVLDLQGNLIFDEDPNVDGLYRIGVEDRAAALDLVKLYVGSDYNGGNFTRVLDNGNGSIKVAPGENGIFFSVTFNVETIKPFTLDIWADNDENGQGTYQKCPICGRTWMGASSKCPWTAQHPA